MTLTLKFSGLFAVMAALAAFVQLVVVLFVVLTSAVWTITLLSPVITFGGVCMLVTLGAFVSAMFD